MSFHKNILFSGSFLLAKICCINFAAITGRPSSKYEHRSTGRFMAVLWVFQWTENCLHKNPEEGHK